jgi:hypothetical protein
VAALGIGRELHLVDREERGLQALGTAPIERPALVDWTIRDFIARRIDGADPGVLPRLNDAIVRE